MVAIQTDTRPQLIAIFTLLALIVALGSAFFAVAYETNTSLSPHAEPAAIALTEAPNPFEGIVLFAKSAVVLDTSNGHVLYAKNADAQLPLASLTKVALALVVNDVIPEDSLIPITHNVGPTSHTTRLIEGQKFKAKDLISFMLSGSSNEAAQILAETADEPLRARFMSAPHNAAAVWRMNERMVELGLYHTYFLNATGLDESTTQAGAYGSAYDIARLFGYAASSSESLFAETAEQKVTITSTDGTSAGADNTDLALDIIPGLVMGKTGTTDLAGGNLAVVYDVGHHHLLVAVVLGSTEDGRFTDIRTLVDRSKEVLATQ